MAGLTDLFAMALKAMEVAPANTTARCLNSTEGAGACSACLDVCPHGAVSIERLVAIDGVDCTGCGLCVRACPSEALEMQTRLPAGSTAVRCSQVSGSAPSVRCLAQLSATDMLRMGAADGDLTLGHGACQGCKIGDASAPSVARATAERAAELAAVLGRELRVSVEPMESLDEKRRRRTVVSRRQLFGGGLKEARRLAADALAPLERVLPGEEEGLASDLEPLPNELRRRYQALQIADPEPTSAVPWRLPRVADGCILCPACTRACPTDAFSRDFGGEEGVLMLDPERCVGCDACVRACPVKVITMDDEVTWGELAAGKQEAYRASPEKRAPGSFHR